MASQPRPRLPNELIDDIFKQVDCADKAQCAAICRTSKAGMRAMCGLNEEGEAVGPSVMYHTLAYNNSKGKSGVEGSGMVLLIRTLIERPALAEQVSRLKITKESTFSDPQRGMDQPDLNIWLQKLSCMALPISMIIEIFGSLTFREIKSRYLGAGLHHLILVIICTRLQSFDVVGLSENISVTFGLNYWSHRLTALRKVPPNNGQLGKCGLDSIEHFTYRDHSASFGQLGFALPGLRRLTIYDMAAWEFHTYMFHQGKNFGSTIEQLDMLGCYPGTLRPSVFSINGAKEGLLCRCPSLKRLYVVWPATGEPEYFWFWDDVARQLGRLCEEICFDTSATSYDEFPDLDDNACGVKANKFSAANNVASDGHPDTLEDAGHDVQICRFGYIKDLTNLQKLRLPKVACVGYGPDDIDDEGNLWEKSPGVIQNFHLFLAESLPDDTSQLEFEIVCPTYLLSNEDQALLSYAAAYKEFKSITVYNCSKTAWVSSLDQPTEDHVMIGAPR